MKTFFYITAFLLFSLLKTHASELTCHNKGTATLKFKVYLYSSAAPLVSIGTIDSYFVPANTHAIFDIPDVNFAKVQAFRDVGAGYADLGSTAVLSGESGRVFNYYNEPGNWGTPTTFLYDSPTASRDQSIEIFKSGFYLSIGVGITGLMWSLLRGLGRQNHLPS